MSKKLLDALVAMQRSHLSMANTLAKVHNDPARCLLSLPLATLDMVAVGEAMEKLRIPGTTDTVADAVTHVLSASKDFDVEPFIKRMAPLRQDTLWDMLEESRKVILTYIFLHSLHSAPQPATVWFNTFKIPDSKWYQRENYLEDTMAEMRRSLSDSMLILKHVNVYD